MRSGKPTGAGSSSVRDLINWRAGFHSARFLLPEQSCRTGSRQKYAMPSATQNPETTATPANRRFDMHYPIPNRCPRNTPPEVRESKLRVADPDGPPSRKKIRMRTLRTRRMRVCSITGSAVHRTDNRRESPNEPLRSRSAPASHPVLACPNTTGCQR